MFRKSSSWALKGAFALCAFALCLCAGPDYASAITFISSGNSYALTPVTTYSATDGTFGSGAFTHTYEFVYSPPPGLAAPVSVTTNNVNGDFNIPSLDIDWYKATTASVALVADNISGTGTATDSLTLKGAANYFLVLSGVVPTGAAGQYTLTVSTGKGQNAQLTPLPGALVLFGSALTGGVVLLRRRRSAVQKMQYGLAA